MPVTVLEGAVDEDITSGAGKEIVWTIITQDVALYQYGEGYVVAIMADMGLGLLSRLPGKRTGL